MYCTLKLEHTVATGSIKVRSSIIPYNRILSRGRGGGGDIFAKDGNCSKF